MHMKASFYATVAAVAIGLAAPAAAQVSSKSGTSTDQPRQQMEQQSRDVQSGQQQGQAAGQRSDQPQQRQGGATQSGQATGQQQGGASQSGQATGQQQAVGVIVVPVEFRTVRADQLIGKEVRGAGGEDLGEIKDVVMARDKQGLAAVVDVGGFLGIGEKSVAISFDQLAMQGDRIVAKNLTKERAENLTPYVSTDWQPVDRNKSLGEAG